MSKLVKSQYQLDTTQSIEQHNCKRFISEFLLHGTQYHYDSNEKPHAHTSIIDDICEITPPMTGRRIQQSRSTLSQSQIRDLWIEALQIQILRPDLDIILADTLKPYDWYFDYTVLSNMNIPGTFQIKKLAAWDTNMLKLNIRPTTDINTDCQGMKTVSFDYGNKSCIDRSFNLDLNGHEVNLSWKGKKVVLLSTTVVKSESISIIHSTKTSKKADGTVVKESVPIGTLVCSRNGEKMKEIMIDNTRIGDLRQLNLHPRSEKERLDLRVASHNLDDNEYKQIYKSLQYAMFEDLLKRLNEGTITRDEVSNILKTSTIPDEIQTQILHNMFKR